MKLYFKDKNGERPFEATSCVSGCKPTRLRDYLAPYNALVTTNSKGWDLIPHLITPVWHLIAAK